MTPKRNAKCNAVAGGSGYGGGRQRRKAGGERLEIAAANGRDERKLEVMTVAVECGDDRHWTTPYEAVPAAKVSSTCQSAQSV